MSKSEKRVVRIHNGEGWEVITTSPLDRMGKLIDLLLSSAERSPRVIRTSSGKKIQLQRGDAVFIQEEAARNVGVTSQTIHHYIKTLREFGFIQTRRMGPYGLLVSVQHFDKYPESQAAA